MEDEMMKRDDLDFTPLSEAVRRVEEVYGSRLPSSSFGTDVWWSDSKNGALAQIQIGTGWKYTVLFSDLPAPLGHPWGMKVETPSGPGRDAIMVTAGQQGNGDTHSYPCPVGNSMNVWGLNYAEEKFPLVDSYAVCAMVNCAISCMDSDYGAHVLNVLAERHVRR